MSRGPRSLRARLFVLAGAVLAALLLAELFVRVARPRAAPLAPYHVQARFNDRWVDLGGQHSLLISPTDDPALADMARGLFVGELRFRLCYDVENGPRRPYFDEAGCVEVTINAERYRGPLRPRAKPEGVRRIALVGDSFTFGHGVPYDATWGAVLERLLNAEAPDDARVEVLNFAVSGHDARDAADMLRGRALAWQPDRLLYGFFLNDLLVGEDDGGEAWRGVDEQALLDAVFGRSPGLADRSRLVELVRRTLARRRLDRLTQSAYLEAATPGSAHYDVWRAALVEMAEAAAGAGVPLDVVVFPELVRLGADHPLEPAYEAVAAVAGELGLGVVQVLEAWRGEQARELWVHPTDHHPNEHAHAAAAELVAAHLRRAAAADGEPGGR